MFKRKIMSQTRPVFANKLNHKFTKANDLESWPLKVSLKLYIGL